MRGKWVLIVGLLTLWAGCAEQITITKIDDVRAMNAQNMLKLNSGMNKQEVLNIMGVGIIQTEKIEVYRTGGYQVMPYLKISNPYRTETIRASGDKLFEVYYYFTDLKSPGDSIQDEDLTPLIFDDDKLIGWGWGFFQDTAQKYKIERKVR